MHSDAWTDALHKAGLHDLASRRIDAMRPGISLMPTFSRKHFSKLGGSPDLPGYITWPSWQDRRLTLVLQLDFAEVQSAVAASDLPSRGRLWFFYDIDRLPTISRQSQFEGWRLLFDDAPVAANAIEPTTASSTLRDEELPEQPIEFGSIRTYPSVFHIATDEEESVLYDRSSFDESGLCEPDDQSRHARPLHQLLGHATPIHPWNEGYDCEFFYQRLVNDNTVDEATLEANSQDWMLLLQIDSIPPDWTWGDNGLLYVYIRRQDLAARDFSKVCVEMECY